MNDDRRERRRQLLAGIMIGGRRHPEASRVGFVWGLMIAAIGVFLLLDHLDLIRIGSLLRFWPMILIFFGIGHLFTPSNRIWGVILILIGAVFQLNNLGILHEGIADLWPVLIIAVGLLLMWAAMRPPVPVVSTEGGDSASDTVNAVAIFGGCERRINSQHFSGGRSMSVFGGVELDFRDANIQGDEAVLEVNCIFGGVEIRVPPSWYVHSKSIPILGGFSDKTHRPANADPAAPKGKTLVITGAVVFGGVEISN
ncbi:MAG TPA: DUF5668 domain-containing protein [Candidatus Methylomirabilis sp.]|nr:DUF5668 domain-containing protein [Candidatus Methylomirabilis sp.]